PRLGRSGRSRRTRWCFRLTAGGSYSHRPRQRASLFVGRAGAENWTLSTVGGFTPLPLIRRTQSLDAILPTTSRDPASGQPSRPPRHRAPPVPLSPQLAQISARATRRATSHPKTSL